MTKGSNGDEVMMGDLVLLEDEVNPVMSALLDNGFDVTALHNHFFFDSPHMGAPINSRMGLNTWAAFFGSDANAEIAGDVAMLGPEVTPVLKALRSHGLEVVAIHQHMLGTEPSVYFLHYWGTGSTEKLASGFKAALDELGAGKNTRSALH
jgi:hypothetical protein